MIYEVQEITFLSRLSLPFAMTAILIVRIYFHGMEALFPRITIKVTSFHYRNLYSSLIIIILLLVTTNMGEEHVGPMWAKVDRKARK